MGEGRKGGCRGGRGGDKRVEREEGTEREREGKDGGYERKNEERREGASEEGRCKPEGVATQRRLTVPPPGFELCNEHPTRLSFPGQALNSREEMISAV